MHQRAVGQDRDSSIAAPGPGNGRIVVADQALPFQRSTSGTVWLLGSVVSPTAMHRFRPGHEIAFSALAIEFRGSGTRWRTTSLPRCSTSGREVAWST